MLIESALKNSKLAIYVYQCKPVSCLAVFVYMTEIICKEVDVGILLAIFSPKADRDF